MSTNDESAFTPWENPMGTDGFEFIEYAAPDPAAMGKVFEQMGFRPIAKHRHKNVLLYRQGTINSYYIKRYSFICRVFFQRAHQRCEFSHFICNNNHLTLLITRDGL